MVAPRTRRQRLYTAAPSPGVRSRPAIAPTVSGRRRCGARTPRRSSAPRVRAEARGNGARARRSAPTRRTVGRRALEAGAERPLDSIFQLLRIVLRRKLEVPPALSVVTELEVTRREGVVGEDVEEPGIVGQGAVDLAGPAACDQALEERESLLGASRPHQRDAAQPVQLVIVRKPLEGLGQQAPGVAPSGQAPLNEPEVGQAVLPAPGSRPLPP